MIEQTNVKTNRRANEAMSVQQDQLTIVITYTTNNSKKNNKKNSNNNSNSSSFNFNRWLVSSLVI